MIAYNLLLARKHGESSGYPLLVSFDDPLPLTRRYEELTGSACAEFARENAELLFVTDGVVLAHHDFPDPKEVEAARKAKVLGQARSIQAANDAAEAEVAAAKERAATAASAVRKLTGEQKALLAEETRAKQKAAAEQKAREDAEAEAAAAEQAERQKEADAETARIETAAARDTLTAELASQTDEQLSKLASDNKIIFATEPTREEMIASIIKAAGLE